MSKSQVYKTGLVITGDSGGAVKAIRLTNSELDKLSGKSKSASSGVKSTQGAVSGGALAFGAYTAAIGAAAAGISGLVASLRTDAIRELDIFSRQLGVSAESLQTWGFAAQSVGINTEKLGDMFKDISDKIGDFAVTEGGAARDMFDRLNLSLDEMIKLAPDQQLLKIGQALNGIGRNEQIFFMEALASDASRLIPLLADGNRELERLFRQSSLYGETLSQLDVSAVSIMAQSFDHAGTALERLADQITAGLAPAFSFMAEGFAQAAGGIRGAQGAAEAFGDGVIWLIAQGKDFAHSFTIGFEIVKTGLVGMKAALINAFIIPIETISQAFADFANWMIEGVAGMVEQITRAINAIPDFLKTDSIRAAQQGLAQISQSIRDAKIGQLDLFRIDDDVVAEFKAQADQLHDALMRATPGEEYLAAYEAAKKTMRETAQVMAESAKIQAPTAKLKPIEKEEKSVKRITIELKRQVDLAREFRNLNQDMWTDFVRDGKVGIEKIEKTFVSFFDNIAGGNIFDKFFDQFEKAFKGDGIGLKDLFSTQGQSGFGGFMGSIGGQAIAAGVGQVGGQALGGGGQGAQMGSSIGAAIGTAILPGIGTLIGGILGGLGGGVFDGEPLQEKIQLQSGAGAVGGGVTHSTDGFKKFENEVFARSEFGFVGLTEKSRGLDDHLKKLTDTFVAFDDSIAAFLNKDEINKARAALSGWRSDRLDWSDENFFELLKSRAGSVSDALGNATGRAMDSLAQASDSVAEFGEKLQELANIAPQLDVLFGAGIDKAAELINETGGDFQQRFINAVAGTDPGFERDVAAKNLADTVDRLGISLDEAEQFVQDWRAGLIDLSKVSAEIIVDYQTLYMAGKNLSDANERLAETEKEIAAQRDDFNANFRRQLRDLNLSGVELELQQLADSFIQTKEAAREAGGDIILVEQFFTAQREQILKRTAENMSEALQSIASTAESVRRSIERSTAQIKKVSAQDTISGLVSAYFDTNDNMTRLDLINQAQAAVVERYNEELAAVQATREAAEDRYQADLDHYQAMKDAARELNEFLDGILLSNISPLTNKERMDEARAQFETQVAMGGSADPGQLRQAAQNFLTESRAYNASGSAYLADFSRVQQAVGGIADSLGSALPPEQIRYQQQAIQEAEIQSRALQDLKLLQETVASIEAQARAEETARQAEMRRQVELFERGLIQQIQEADQRNTSLLLVANDQILSQERIQSIQAVEQTAAMKSVNQSVSTLNAQIRSLTAENAAMRAQNQQLSAGITRMTGEVADLTRRMEESNAMRNHRR